MQKYEHIFFRLLVSIVWSKAIKIHRGSPHVSYVGSVKHCETEFQQIYSLPTKSLFDVGWRYILVQLMSCANDKLCNLRMAPQLLAAPLAYKYAYVDRW